MIRLLVKIFGWAVFLLLVVAGGAWVYIFKLGGLEEIINARLAAIIPEESRLEVNVGIVSGDLISELTAEDIQVYYNDSTQRLLLLDLPRLTAAYSLTDLWNRDYSLDYLLLDSASLIIHTDSTGKMILPSFGSDPNKKRQLPSIVINELGIDNLRLTIIRADDTLRFEQAGIALAIAIDDEMLTVAVERFEFTTGDERFSLDAAGGILTYSQENLVFEDIAVVTGDTRVNLDGMVAFGNVPSGNVRFDIDNLDLVQLSSYFGPRLWGNIDLNGQVSFVGSKINGTVDVGGRFLFIDVKNLFLDLNYADKYLRFDTLYGTVFDGCSVDGSGFLDVSKQTYQVSADVKNFNLNGLKEGTLDSDLSGRVVMDGRGFKNDSLLLDFDVDLFESSFHHYPMHTARGRLHVTKDSVTFDDPFRVSWYENTFYCDGTISYKNDMDLFVRAELNNLDRWRNKLFIDQPGGRGWAEVRIHGSTRDPNMTGFFVSDSIWIYGIYADSMRADIDIERFLNRRQGPVLASLHQGRAYSVAFDSTRVVLQLDSNLVYIDTVVLRNKVTTVTANGTYDYGVYPSQLDFDSLQISLFEQIFYNNRNVKVNVDSSGFAFTRASIVNSDALLSVIGRANFDESLDLSLALDRVAIASWLNLFDSTVTIDGLVSCGAVLNGTIASPRFTLDGTIDSLSYRDLVLGDLSTRLNYNGQKLSIDSFLVQSPGGSYHADGSLYLNLSLAVADTTDRLLDLPMDIHIVARDTLFDLVSLILPSIEEMGGEFYGDITLSGTPHDPHLEGDVYLRNGFLKYFDLEHLFHVDSAGVTMQDNKVLIDSIDVYVFANNEGGKRSHAIVEGELTVLSLDQIYYDLDVTLPREFPFSYELADISGVAEGELHVEGTTPPLVTGDITLLNTKYVVEFTRADEGSPIMLAFSGNNQWNLDINIDMLSNYWIKNEDIDAEFAGQLNLLRTNGQYRFLGEMEVLRGRGFLFDKVIHLEPGSKVFFEGSDTLNPRLDIVGHTRITVYNQEVDSLSSEQIEVGIQVTGTLEEPQFNPTEESLEQEGFTRADIMPLLVANYYSSDRGATSTQLEQRIAGLVTAQMSQVGSRQLGQIGVETFAIDRIATGGSDQFDARVTLGSYRLFPVSNLYTYYRGTLSSPTKAAELGFEYRLNKHFMVEGRRDELGLGHLNMKLHLEF